MPTGSSTGPIEVRVHWAQLDTDAETTPSVQVRVYWAQLDTNVAENVIPLRRSSGPSRKRKPHKDEDLLLFIGAM